MKSATDTSPTRAVRLFGFVEELPAAWRRIVFQLARPSYALVRAGARSAAPARGEMAVHEQVDRLFGVLSWLRHQRLDRVDNTHARMDHYERVPRASFFPAPPPVAPLALKRGLLGLGADYETLVFRSAHVPLHPEEVTRYFAEQQALHQFRVRRVRARNPSLRRACVYLHPWMADGTGWIDLGFSKMLARAFDADVYNLEQVHHGRRLSRGARFAGAHFFSADVARTVESVRQAVCDARTLVRYLESTGEYDEVGVLGVSLGGTVATICACLEPLAWCVAALAHLEIPDAVRHAPIAAHSRKQLREFGVSLDELDRLHESLLAKWLEPMDPERLLLIAGRRDACMRAEIVERQLARWSGVRCTWVEGGHITSMLRLRPHLVAVRAQIDALPSRRPSEREIASRMGLHTS